MTQLDAYSFQFPNQSGWPAGANGSWTHQRGAAVTNIFNNEGQISGDNGTFNIWTYGSQGRDVVLQTRYIPGATGDLWGLVARYQNGHYYFVDVGDGGQIIEIGMFNGSFVQLASAGFSFSGGTAYQIKFRLEMAQLSVKAWLDGQPEPTNWNIQISDTTYVVSGAYGIGVQTSSGTPILIDHWSASTADFNYGTLISRNLAAYAPDINGGANPAYFANNSVYSDLWQSAATPTSGSPIGLTYDLGPIASNRRQNVLLRWLNDPQTGNYNPALFGTLYFNCPKNYTIDANSATSGGAVPSSGWVTLATVTNNPYHSRSHVLNLTGYNWIRMQITDINGSNLNMAVAINLDIVDTTAGIDSIIWYGDSIPQNGLIHSDSSVATLEALINASRPARWPLYENGSIGGTKSADGAANISTWLAVTPARYVGICYGTNDALQSVAPNTFASNVQTILTAILGASKTPLVSHIPWGSDSNILANAPALNAKLDQLIASNPGCKTAPDFWSYYSANQALISNDGIHPTTAGYIAYRNLWASWLLSNIYPTTLPMIGHGKHGIRWGSHPGSIFRGQVGS